MPLKVLMHDIRKLETDAVVVGFHEDVRPLKGAAGALDWLLCGSLSQLIIQHKVRGALGDVALLTSKGKIPASKIFLVGLGPRAELSPAALRTAARTAAASVVNAGAASAGLDLVPQGGFPGEDAFDAFREGLAEGTGTHACDITVIAPDAEALFWMTRSAGGRRETDRRSS